MCGWSGQCVRVEFLVSFVDGLTQRNAGERNDLWIHGCLHQDERLRMRGEERSQNGWNLNFERAARLDVLGAFDVRQRVSAKDHQRIPQYEGE